MVLHTWTVRKYVQQTKKQDWQLCSLLFRIAQGKGGALPHVTSPTAVATPGATPGLAGPHSNQRWKFMDDTGKLRKVSGRLFSEPSATLRSACQAVSCISSCKHEL